MRIYTWKQGVTGVNYLGIYILMEDKLNVIQLDFVSSRGRRSGIREMCTVLGNTKNGLGKIKWIQKLKLQP